MVQRHVLYLGEINDAQRAPWWRSIAVFDEDAGAATPLALFPADRQAPEPACRLWDLLELDTFWPPRLPLSRKGTRWLNALKTLVAYRLIDPGSEWRLHRSWYDHSALGDLLGEDFAIAHSHTLYRCLAQII